MNLEIEEILLRSSRPVDEIYKIINDLSYTNQSLTDALRSAYDDLVCIAKLSIEDQRKLSKVLTQMGVALR